MGWKVVQRGGKLIFSYPGVPALVVKIREWALVPRWRVKGALAFSAFASGAALTTGQLIPGLVMGALALFVLIVG